MSWVWVGYCKTSYPIRTHLTLPKPDPNRLGSGRVSALPVPIVIPTQILINRKIGQTIEARVLRSTDVYSTEPRSNHLTQLWIGGNFAKITTTKTTEGEHRKMYVFRSLTHKTCLPFLASCIFSIVFLSSIIARRLHIYCIKKTNCKHANHYPTKTERLQKVNIGERISLDF